MAIEKTGKTVISFSDTSMYGERLPEWVCVCDTCGKASVKTSTDPGQLAELVRREGFRTVSGTPGSPMWWLCPACTKKAS